MLLHPHGSTRQLSGFDPHVLESRVGPRVPEARDRDEDVDQTDLGQSPLLCDCSRLHEDSLVVGRSLALRQRVERAVASLRLAGDVDDGVEDLLTGTHEVAREDGLGSFADLANEPDQDVLVTDVVVVQLVGDRRDRLEHLLGGCVQVHGQNQGHGRSNGHRNSSVGL